MIYKTRVFCSLTKKSGLSDDDLIRSCHEMELGLIDANLAGHLFKKRVGYGGKGKRGGYRTIVGAVIGEKYFFLYAFAKNQRGNISAKEQLALKELAREFVNFKQKDLEQLVEAGELMEVGE